MKIWIPGSDGELGTCVVQAAKNAGHDPIGTIHEQCSIEDPAMVFAVVETICPDVILNCVRKQPGSDPVEMLMANAVGPHVLASTKVRLVHMSTDCVFSGSHAHGGIKIWYSSKRDFPDPDTLYGRSKLAGEPEGSHVLVVRGSYLGIRSTFMQWLLNAQGPVDLWKNAYWNGTDIFTMAEHLVRMAEDEKTGIIHIAAPDHTTKASMARYFIDVLNLPVTGIRYVDEPRIFRVLEPDVELPEIHSSLKRLASSILP